MSAIVKNIVFATVVGGIWFALETGYVSPDRPTRAQWEALEGSKTKPSGKLVYQSDFAREKPGELMDGLSGWDRYNGATASTVQFAPSGITIDYKNAAWLGAVYRLVKFEPRAIYRVTMQGQVETEPAALIVRNRQLDLHRVAIPVGTTTFQTEFVAPPGRADQVYVIFMPDNGAKPTGRMHIKSVRIERLGD